MLHHRIHGRRNGGSGEIGTRGWSNGESSGDVIDNDMWRRRHPKVSCMLHFLSFHLRQMRRRCHRGLDPREGRDFTARSVYLSLPVPDWQTRGHERERWEAATWPPRAAATLARNGMAREEGGHAGRIAEGARRLGAFNYRI